MVDMKELTPVWTALSDQKRRLILTLLSEKPRTTSELSEYFDVSRFAVMKHLTVLEEANLVQVKREGRQRWNILNRELLQRLEGVPADGDGDYAAGRLPDLLRALQGNGRRQDEPQAAHIEESVTVAAAAAEVFTALTMEIDAWWPLRNAPDSKMHLEPRVNGRFYEAFDDQGQGALYGAVTFIREGSELRLDGPMGIAEEMVNSTVRFTLQAGEAEGETRLDLSHRLYGVFAENALQLWTDRWREVLGVHLKAFVEEM
jgi:DNA-binding transcriptional ArsR family regulator